MALDAAPEARGVLHSSRLAEASARAFAALLVLLPAAAPLRAAELRAWTGPAGPAFALAAVGGGSLGPGDFAGRPLVVHFFATWCAPCVEELGALDRMAAAGGIAVLAVDVGEVEARVARFLEAHPVGFPVVLDPDRKVTRGWGVVALPSSFVLDGEQRIVGFVEGDLGWDAPAVAARLEELVGNREEKADDQPT